MTQELSFMQLKSSNEARVSEEQRTEQRKRNLLLLVLQFFHDEGYLEAAQALETEAGVSLKKFEVCDNIDLTTILQEYESYYFIKFQKWPKITKRTRDSGDNKGRGLHQRSRPPRSLSKSNMVCLPSINGGAETAPAPTSSSSSSSADSRKRGPKSKATPTMHAQTSASDSPSPSDIGLSVLAITNHQKVSNKEDDMQGKRVIVDHRAILNNALKGNFVDQMTSSDRLLKPLSGYAGLTGELRDLAAVISREIYLEDPDVRWSDIIGLDEAKRLVKEAVVYPIKYPQLFSGILSPWKGLLLYGPPGTGKTLLAKAVATECKTTFFNISASSIVSKWRGDSEKLVRVLFELARFHAPSTIFLDELDSLMSHRGSSSGGSGEHEGSRRMKTELLVQMDGLSRSDDLVFLLAASNIPWELDHAMLRRLEKRILVGLPTTEARKSMVQHYLPPVLPSKEGGLELKTFLDYDTLAEKMEGYSGSDLCLVCKEAAMRPIRKIFDILEGGSPGDEKKSKLATIQVDPILTADVEAALERTKPSSRTHEAKYKEWQMQYESV